MATTGSRVRELTSGDFQQAVAEGVTLVDFWAPWCGPCRMMGPVLGEVAEELAESAVVAKVNVDDAPDLAARFGVRAIPYLVVLADGAVVEQLVGVQPKAQLVAAVRKHL